MPRWIPLVILVAIIVLSGCALNFGGGSGEVGWRATVSDACGNPSAGSLDALLAAFRTDRDEGVSETEAIAEVFDDCGSDEACFVCATAAIRAVYDGH